MKYTDEELIEELHRVSEEHCDGETPTQKDMNKYGNISQSTFGYRFGSWNESLKEAGFNINSIFKYSEEEMLNEIERLCDENDIVTTATIQEESEISLSAILNNFENLREILNIIGEEDKISVRSQNIEKDDILEIAKDFKEGNQILKSELIKETKLNNNHIDRYWKSWNDFLKDIECEINYRTYSNEYIENSVKELSEQVDGKMPTKYEIDNNCEFSRQTVLDRYGSFTNLARKIGKEPNDSTSRRLYAEEHPNWKGGYEDYYGPSWWSQREKAYKRDDFKCRVCGATKDILDKNPDVHHIKPKYKFDVKKDHEEMNDLENLICLCQSHHIPIEGKWQEKDPDEFEKKAKEFFNSVA